jgi:hypothetical protein
MAPSASASRELSLKFAPPRPTTSSGRADRALPAHPDNGTPVARRVRKARGLTQAAQPPKENPLPPTILIVAAAFWAMYFVVVFACCRAAKRGGVG